MSDAAVEHVSASGMVGVELPTEICNCVLDGACMAEKMEV